MEPRIEARRFACRLVRRFGSEGAIAMLTRAMGARRIAAADRALWMLSIEFLTAGEARNGR